MALPSRNELEAFSRDEITYDELVTKYGKPNVVAAYELYEKEDNESFPGFVDRAAASFGGSPEGEVGILRERGYDAEVTPQGIMATTDYGRRLVDEPGFTFGDIADESSAVLPTLLGSIGAAYAGPFGAVSGEIVGEGGNQAIGNYLGSGQGVNKARLVEAGIIGGAGHFGGEVIARGVNKALAPVKSAMTNRVGRIAERAGELDRAYGTDVAGALPVSAQTESRMVGAVEQRVKENPTTVDDYIAIQERPYYDQTETLLSRIGQRFGPPTSGKQDVGSTLTEAAVDTKEQRKEVVDQMYARVRELVAPNTPVIPEQSIEAVEQIAQRVGADMSDLNAPARETIEGLLNDVNGIRTFGQLDAFRETLGRKLKTQKGSEVFQERGLETQIRRLYGALRRDVDQFYEGGALVTDAAKDRVVNEAAQAAEEAAATAARKEETISVSKAIATLGGMDLSGLAAEEIPGRVGKRLRSLSTQATNQKRPLKGADLMAERLREEYPELGIETLNDLREALRREDRFFDNVPTGATSNIEMEFAARPVTGQETMGFDVPALQEAIENATSMDDLTRAFNGIETALESGEISQFQRDRLRNMANNMAAALGDPSAKAQAGQLADEFSQFERREAGLGQEIAEQGRIARTAYRDIADLDKKNALRVFTDEDKAASIVDRMAKMEAAEIRSIKKKIGALPVESMQEMQVGTLPEGEQAWRLAQRAVFEHIAGKETIDRTQRMTNDMVVRSGERMLTMLDKFKEGALEELLGKKGAGELYNFAELISDANLAARFSRNNSGTAPAIWFNSILSGLRNSFGQGIMFAAGQIGMANQMLKLVTTPGGQRYLTQGALQDATSQNILTNLSNVGARAGYRNLAPRTEGK